MKSAFALLLFLASLSAQAFENDFNTAEMTLRALAPTIEAAGLKKLPNSPRAKLPKDLQELLDTHLKEVMEIATRNGIKVLREGRALKVQTDGRTPVGRIGQELERAGLNAIIYDPLQLSFFHVEGAYDDKTKILYVGLIPLLNGEEDSIFHHEAVHARNHLSPGAISKDLRLTLQSTGKAKLRPEALIYSRYLSSDELCAYVAELRFLLKVAGATTEPNEETGVTPFADKLSLFSDVLQTAEFAANSVAGKKARVKDGKLVYGSMEISFPADAAAPEALVAALSLRAGKMRKHIHEIKEPAALVAALESDLR